jgi:chromate transporter
MAGPESTAPAPVAAPTFREALAYWVKLGFLNFGGPAGQIALMHRDLVERRRWIGERPFLAALDVCMFLPGPEAQQLATQIGWRLHGVRGGVAAGACFVLPSVALLLLLSWLYAAWGGLPGVVAVLGGIKPVVVAIIAAALLRIARRAVRTPLHAALAAAALIAIAWLRVPFPAIVGGAALAGLAASRFAPRPSGDSLENGADPPALEPAARRIPLLGLGAAGLVLWALPAAALILLRGTSSLHLELYLFFTRASFVTFGGAYAVLAYVADLAIASGWLTRHAMVDGLALAETTPGPLIIVLQFVGFMAGWSHPQGMSPAAAGVLAALATTWATFLPSTLLGLATAPFAERLDRLEWARAALGAVTAAVVGVIASLGLFLAGEVFLPAAAGGRPDWVGAAIAAAATIALVRYRVEAHWTIAAGALLGWLRLAVGI